VRETIKETHKRQRKEERERRENREATIKKKAKLVADHKRKRKETT
jgi:hypothetical protein